MKPARSDQGPPDSGCHPPRRALRSRAARLFRLVAHGVLSAEEVQRLRRAGKGSFPPASGPPWPRHRGAFAVLGGLPNEEGLHAHNLIGHGNTGAGCRAWFVVLTSGGETAPGAEGAPGEPNRQPGRASRSPSRERTGGSRRRVQSRVKPSHNRPKESPRRPDLSFQYSFRASDIARRRKRPCTKKSRMTREKKAACMTSSGDIEGEHLRFLKLDGEPWFVIVARARELPPVKYSIRKESQDQTFTTQAQSRCGQGQAAGRASCR